ncbi:MAG: hypothetical protein JW913_07935 [Chitinispirillaceae bacterium]|nr:hypothetical protein [Chitinispirillaceae bacterium]
MKRPLFTLLKIVLFFSAVWPASGGTNPIDSGYGADGPFRVCRDSMPSPSMREASIHLFRPCRTDTAWPVIFFLHGIGAHDPANYRELLEHLASRGHAVIYPPYTQAIAMARPQAAYKSLREGFERGVTQWRTLLDSTRIGFIGHSYGGGAVPAISRQWIAERKWGARGAFLYIMAPWYSYDISPQQLESFPEKTALIMQVFEHDFINDHRMAKDIFDNIGIPETRKNFIILRSDSSNGTPLYAGHNVPVGAAGGESCNQLDYYGVWRLVDALGDYALRGDTAARVVALGSGNDTQRFMGLRPDGTPVRELTGGHTAFVLHPQNSYLNFWNHASNPRYKLTSFFEDRPDWRQRRHTTIRNYMTMRPGTEGTPDSMFASHSTEGLLFAPIDSGYGAQGPYKVTKRDFPHPDFGHGKIYLISPEGIDHPAPVILFLHGFKWAMPDYYQGFITNIVSQGYHVVFPSYLLYHVTFNNKRRYDLMVSGAEEAFEILGPAADTSRIGFIGHSYGGGAVPAIAWHFLKLREWGRAGAFMFIIAPWYVFNFNQYQFDYFPAHAKMLLQVYEGERFNDWRMAEDLFYSFTTIPAANKDFMIVHSDHYKGRQLEAEHVSPLSTGDDDIDAIDFHALYRMADALAAASFRNDTAAQTVALGNGSAAQINMGTWPDGTPVTRLTVTDRPVNPHFQKHFLFNWNRPWNPRRRHYTPVEKAKPGWLYREKGRD